MTDQDIKTIWDSFGSEGQNMPFNQFRKEVRDLTDPNKMMSDVRDIELRRARQRSRQIRIDHARKKLEK